MSLFNGYLLMGYSTVFHNGTSLCTGARRRPRGIRRARVPVFLQRSAQGPPNEHPHLSGVGTGIFLSRRRHDACDAGALQVGDVSNCYDRLHVPPDNRAERHWCYRTSPHSLAGTPSAFFFSLFELRGGVARDVFPRPGFAA
ncbi:hypothetical protein JKF63_01888 [Porcisia hertigi]|uniref:Uncharacterized protein n=1 Tax=Porcisia hertigi TaxID=2761500 RepID=A0A836HJT5_9TRYP|nr:hypothetical protein JKF63_01888 [Porcisia hertigi]